MATTLAIPFSWQPASAAIESSSITVIDDGSGHGSEFQCQLEDPPGVLVDASDSDRVVCTNDTVTWGWGFNMNASGAQDATFTQTLPEGWTWDDLSIAACEGSGLEWTGVGTISADGRTLTCVINQPTGDIVQTLQIPVTANVGPAVPNGSAYAAELSLTEGGVTQTSTADAVTVRSAPRYDLTKTPFGAATVQHDFGDGPVTAHEVAWGVTIEVPDSDNTKGLEPLASPFTFVDNVSQISPNAVVIDVISESSGTATVSQADVGAPATITVTGADTAPADGLNGSGNRVWSALIITRLPQSELPPAPIGKNLINQLTDFLPTGINGTPNLGGTPEEGSEPGADCRNLTDSSAPRNNNCALAFAAGPGSAGVISGTKGLASGTEVDGTPCLPGEECPGLEGDTGGENGYAVPGAPVNAFMLLRVQGPADGVVLCDKWDPARQQFDPTRPIALSGSAGGAVAEADYRIEYTNQAYADDTARQAGGCGLPGDAATDGPWFTTVAAAGGPGAITGVRVTLLRTQPSGEVYWTVPMVAGTLGGPTPDFFSARADGMNASTPVGRNGYRITPQILEVDKDTSPTNQINTSTGSTVNFTLDPSVTVPGNPAAPPVTGLRVTDTLDPCQLGPALDASSTDWIMELTTPANNGADGLPCTGDGESGAVLAFVHRAPFVTPNIPVQQIRYSVTVSPFVENNGSITNTAIISADGNTQDEESRTDAFTQRVAAPGAVRVSKTADFTPVEIEPDDISWTMSWSNTVLLPDTAGRTELIDVLPYNGDGRGTSFNGTFGLLGVDLLGSVADVSVVYTSQDPSTIQRDPATNTSTWCAEAQFGSPGCPTSMASVTAFKIINEDFRNGEFGGARIRVSPAANVESDIYVNNVAQGRTANLPEPIPATPNEPIEVVASSVGDTVWFDADRDGVRDAGEAGIADVTVRLYDAAGTQLRTATTNADGQYTFGNLHSGTYRVDLDPATIPAGYTPTYDLDGGIISPDRNSGAFTLEFDTDRIDVDFGEFRQPGVPSVDIEKETAAGQDADTLETGVYVRPGTSVDVVIPVINTGDEALTQVVVSDETIAGPDMTGFECTFPDGTTGSALPNGSIRWEATFSVGGLPPTERWEVDEQIDCTGTLAMEGGDPNHLNTVTVEAVDLSGDGLTGTDDLHAYTASIDIVKFDGRQAAPANPVDGHDDLDGIFDGPTTGAWDVAVDADTTDDRVSYAAAGSYEVGFIVTNNGAIPVQGVSVADQNLSGPAVTGLSCDFTALGGAATGTTFDGVLEPGQSFPCTATLTMAASESHQDSAGVTAQPLNPVTRAVIGDETIDDEDRYTAVVPAAPGVPSVDIEKETAAGQDADTLETGVYVRPGTSVDVVIPVINTGDEALTQVVVSDETIAGPDMTGFECTFPDGTTGSALPNGSIRWEATFSVGGLPPTERWEVDEQIDCTGTLAMEGGDPNHLNTVTVEAVDLSGDGLTGTDDLHAYTASIDIVKFDGRQAAPANPVDGHDDLDGIFDGPTTGAWDVAVDADTTDDRVSYAAAGSYEVGFIVTNNGAIPVQGVSVADQNLSGPAVTGLSCDFTALGGAATGTTFDGVLEPGQSFPCTATLTMAASESHQDSAGVTAQPLNPVTRAVIGDETIDDEDRYTAVVPAAPGVPSVDIEKETAAGQDADTLETGVYVRPGTSVDVVIPVINTGDEALTQVVVSDETIAGPDMTGFECTFPDGTTGSALPNGSIRWEATFSVGGLPPTERWEVDEQIDCTGTLAMEGGDPNHLNTVTVEAVDLSGDGLTGTDDLHAYTASIDIVKFDGRQAAPANPVDGHDDLDGIFDGPTTGAWDVAVDADTTDDRVSYAAAGSYEVGFIVTNNGAIPVQGVSVADQNLSGPAVTGLSCDFTALGGAATGTTFDGVLEPGQSFPCTATLTMAASESHQDSAGVTAQPLNPVTRAVIGDETIDDEDRYTAVVPGQPGITVEKETVAGQDADTPATGVYVPAGGSVNISIPITNSGDKPLVNVEVADTLNSGPAVASFACTFPDGTTGTTQADGSITWDATTTVLPAQPARLWAVGETFTCTGTLTMPAGSDDHADTVEVNAFDLDGTGVEATDPFHAFTASVDIVKFDGRQTAPANPVDGPDDADGVYDGPTTGAWTPGVDADTTTDAVAYPDADPKPVGFIVTNNGAKPLANLNVTDTVLTGASVTGVSCDFTAVGGPATGTTWVGPLAPGASFPCAGTLDMASNDSHLDNAIVTANPVIDDVVNLAASVSDEDRFNATTPQSPDPEIDIEKESADGEDADSAAAGVYVPAGGTVDIVMPVTNTSTVELVDVVVTDTHVAGPQATSFTCTFPDGTTGTTAQPGEELRWEATFTDPTTVTWAPGESFECTATLTMPAGSANHVDTVTVDAADLTGTGVTDTDEFNTFTASVDIVKFDGNATPPANPVDGADDLDNVYDGPTAGAWDPKVDADTTADQVVYGTAGDKPVGMIVTNNGANPIRDLAVQDLTLSDPAIAGLSCDFSALGGPATGTTWAGPLAPGASFPCTGTLPMAAGDTHQDSASVTAVPVTPVNGVIVGDESLADEDRFNATLTVPGVTIEKESVPGDDADTPATGVYVPAGESVDIQIPITNSGDKPLVNVEVADTLNSGPAVASFACTFPDGTTGTTQADGSITWDATTTVLPAQPARLWAVGETFTCTGTLTMPAGSENHADTAQVNAFDLDGNGVEATDPFHAFTSSVDIVKFDARQTPPTNPVDGPDDADGVYDGPTTGAWAPGVDADTTADQVTYDVAGQYPVGFVVTNTGGSPLTTLALDDTTLSGVDVTGISCDFTALGGPSTGTSWAGPLEPGESFACTGTLDLAAETSHQDSAAITAVPAAPGTSTPLAGQSVDDEDRYTARAVGEPEIVVEKEEAVTGVDADTAATGIYVPAGGSVNISIPITNSGDKPLVNVEVADTLNSGPAVASFACTFPDGTTGTTQADGSITWDATTTVLPAQPARTWAVGESFTCTGTLTMPAGSENHADTVEVNAFDLDANAVSGTDPFHAFTSSVDIVKFDGRQTAPATPVDGPDDADGVYDGPTTGSWAPGVDADTTADQVTYEAAGRYEVGFIVTNTGGSPLTTLALVDTTLSGVDVTGISCDFTAVGGPATGTTWAGPLAPGASFPCTGTLDMAAETSHQDTAAITAVPAAPGTTAPLAGQSVDDEDRYTARALGTPTVDIEKLDADGNDADDMATGIYVPAGQSVDIEIPVTNAGDVPLKEVVVSDTNNSGPAMASFACTFPDGTSGTTQADGSIRWDASFGDPPAQTWAAGTSFECTGTLTMPAGSENHTDTVEVNALDLRNDAVEDTDPFNAFTSSIDIVKFDGNATAPADPVDGPDDADGIYDGPTAGAWEAGVDADTTADQVVYELIDGTSGPQAVGFIVTNTGASPLTGLSVTDLTLSGPPPPPPPTSPTSRVTSAPWVGRPPAPRGTGLWPPTSPSPVRAR